MLQAAPSAANPSSAEILLDWYDREGRDLPWRVKGGAPADPYRVWLSEIMLQQTTVEAVKPYFARFLALWPDVRALAAAEDGQVMSAWAGLGYYARARNLLACARAVVERHAGVFPADEAELRALPGIGDYTAAAIAAIAFGRPALVIDGNVERVITRMFRIGEALPQAKPAIRAALATIALANRPGDFAQAMMDLGATICTPKSPQCLLCPWAEACKARAAGDATNYPVKAEKRAKKLRYGLAYVAIDPKGAILLGTRPPSGLLGGMSEVPNSEWLTGEPPAFEPPVAGDWVKLDPPLIHVFTHFELRLRVFVAEVPIMPAPDGLRWVARAALESEALPTLMTKVIRAGLTRR